MLPTKFAVISSQRTGSTLLVRSLDSVPEVFCAGEIFHFGQHTHHREFQYPYLKPGPNVFARAADVILRKRRVDRHLAHFYDFAGRGVRAVGFKLMASQADRYPAVLSWFRKHRVALIFVYRRNTFDAAKSYYVAAMTGQYHSDRKAAAVGQMTVAVDEVEFERFFRSCKANSGQVQQLHKSLGGLLLSYEDLVQDWNDAIANVGRTIGLPDLRVAMSLQRLSGSEGLQFENEDELRLKFEGYGT